MRKNREGEYTVEREFLGQIPWGEAVFRVLREASPQKPGEKAAEESGD